MGSSPSARPCFRRGRDCTQCDPRKSPLAGLFLAGDWTATGWPGTMESAVRSGYAAAEELLIALDRPQDFIVGDLPQARLARRLFGL
ncbi:MAG: FAD-dependent oxidoreductase [Pirellulales bacterium]